MGAIFAELFLKVHSSLRFYNLKILILFCIIDAIPPLHIYSHSFHVLQFL